MPYYADLAAALADGCLHYWPMDAILGPEVIQDQVGNYNGALRSTFTEDASATIYPSDLGSARSITHYGTSSNQLAVVEFDPVASGQTTAFFWDWSLRIRILINSNNNETDLIWFGNIGSGFGDLRIYLYDNKVYSLTNYGNIESAPLALGEWHEIVITNSGTSSSSTQTLYINGASVGTLNFGSGQGGANPYSHTVTMGSRRGAGFDSYYFDGVIDEAAFWDRPLTSGEISSLYNAGTPVSLLQVQTPPAPPVVEYSQTKPSRFFARLTGAPDGLSDLYIPISSFSARIRSARDSYLSVVAPAAESLISDIELRPNGDLAVIEDVEGVETEVLSVNFDSTRIDKGPRSGTTLNLSGNKQYTFSNETRWSIENHSYYSRSNNRSRVRVKAGSEIKPADIIITEGIEFVVDTLTFVGSSNRAYMEIAE